MKMNEKGMNIAAMKLQEFRQVEEVEPIDVKTLQTTKTT